MRCPLKRCYIYCFLALKFYLHYSCSLRALRAASLYNYIAVLAKMQFFKILVIYFSVNLLFFCGQLFSAVSQLICTKFGTNVSSCMRLKQTRAILENFKNQVTTAKQHRKIGQFFAPAVTFSFVVKKQLNFFEKSLLRWHLGVKPFRKCICDSSELWFTQSLSLMEGRKRPILRAIISQTVRVIYGQSLQEGHIGNPSVPIGDIARVWPRMTLNRDTLGSNFRASSFSRQPADLAQMYVRCALSVLKQTVNFEPIGWAAASQFKKIFFN